ncbi:MAG TPA: hypothetical protein VGO47_03605, partial [Chlamydiales bacterium]|nr:hypothetical protein [Chlamydiales bacterium]
NIPNPENNSHKASFRIQKILEQTVTTTPSQFSQVTTLPCRYNAQGAQPSQLPPQQKPPTKALHRPLQVERVEPKDYPKIECIGKTWLAIAKEKRKTTEGDAGSRLRDTKFLLSGIEDWMPHKVSYEVRELYACKDGDGEVQGLAMVCKNSQTRARLSKRPQALYVDLLITDPRNIRCEANELEPGRVEGVGRAFCKFVQEEAPKHGINYIELSPSSSSVPFYLRCGFTNTENKYLMEKALPSSPQMASKL